MPEGDTIHRAAARLRAALVGQTLRRVELPRRPPPLPSIGAMVESVEARGKHLLIATNDGLIVHTHLRMTGSWHLYRTRERWRRSRSAARVILATDDVVAVCFSAPIVEVLDAGGLARHPALRQLGPDLCDPSADLDEVLARLTRLVPPQRTLGEALLDHRVASGIGNVYRCEVLYLAGLAPTTRVAEVNTATYRWLFAEAGALLRANLDGAARTTVAGAPAGSTWVYGRAGDPCRRCGTPIERDQLGDPPRVVDHCPTCQRRPKVCPPPGERTG